MISEIKIVKRGRGASVLGRVTADDNGIGSLRHPWLHRTNPTTQYDKLKSNYFTFKYKNLFVLVFLDC